LPVPVSVPVAKSCSWGVRYLVPELELVPVLVLLVVPHFL
jgi:hypothetical protein